MEALDHQVLIINSKDLVSGTASNFSINLINDIKMPNNFDSIALMTAYIPKSYYLFNSLNNTFQMTDAAGTFTITIPIGNYSFSQIATELVTQINGAGLFCTYTVTATTRTGKFTIASTTASATTPIITFTAASAWYILGFTAGIYTFSGTSGNYTLESPNMVNFQLTGNIEIHCDQTEGGLLAVIIPDTQDYSTILYTEDNLIWASKNLNAPNLGSSSFSFKLINGQNDELLDFNGLDIQFSVVLFKKNNYYKMSIIDRNLRAISEQLAEQSAV